MHTLLYWLAWGVSVPLVVHNGGRQTKGRTWMTSQREEFMLCGYRHNIRRLERWKETRVHPWIGWPFTKPASSYLLLTIRPTDIQWANLANVKFSSCSQLSDDMMAVYSMLGCNTDVTWWATELQVPGQFDLKLIPFSLQTSACVF